MKQKRFVNGSGGVLRGSCSVAAAPSARVVNVDGTAVYDVCKHREPIDSSSCVAPTRPHLHCVDTGQCTHCTRFSIPGHVYSESKFCFHGRNVSVSLPVYHHRTMMQK
jgi:hypothetical protein